MAWLSTRQTNLAPLEARATERRKLHLDAAVLAPSTGAIATVIRDMSETGLLLETPEPLDIGTVIDIDLPEAGPTEAQVVWTSGTFVGCQFATPVTRAAVSAALLRTVPPALRRPEPAPATVTAPEPVVTAERAATPERYPKYPRLARAAIIVGSSGALWAGLFGAAELLA
ncbi:PilZ domain-containing protein [Novosphingobium piscinae]|uniref:PilZ domain-containing protein n=1 Tax=Novosphingobium piscinae TaxID=1507448 RepID=A0A7X1FW97_9SPHN|nr:PilZ domain-containing protein [Novosphingobium piscinae]MBC2668165.1 PilZ domain-containing protein [Novosphingobium piscinae]